MHARPGPWAAPLTAAAKFVVPAAKEDVTDLQLPQRRRAHDARLDRHVQRALRDHGGRPSRIQHSVDGLKLCVACRIARGDGVVVASPNQPLTWVHEYTADGHLLRVERNGSLLQCNVHVLHVGCHEQLMGCRVVR